MPTTCHECGNEYDGDGDCPSCDASPPVDETDNPGVSPPAEDSTEQLRAMLRAHSAEIAELSTRLDRLERASNLRPERPPSSPAPLPPPSDPREMPRRTRSDPPAQPAPPQEARSAESRPREVLPVARYLERFSEQPAAETARTAESAAPPTLPPPIPPRVRTPREPAARRWEWLLGGNWLARVGVVALTLGVAFFISLAIDRGWLGETERVILGLLLGSAMIGAGERYRTQYGVWAQAVAGGGLAILYLSVWGGFALYELIGPLLAFGLFILITAGGVMQALRHDSVGLAALAIFGGFATPLLLRTNLPDEPLLIAYVLLLDIGVLALAGYRNWRWFTLMAYVGSLVLFAFWISQLDPSLGLAQTGLSAIFVVFAAASVAFHVLRRQPARFVDLLLFTTNGVAYLLISYSLMYDDLREWMGGFTALLAILHALLLIGFRLRSESPRTLVPYAAALTVAFAALAVPVQLDGAWVTVAWGAEALALVAISFRLRMPELRWFGALVFIVAAVWLLALDTPDALGDDLSLFINWPMLSYASAMVLPAAAAWILRRRLNDLEHWERPAVAAFAVAAAAIAAVAIPVQLDGVWITVAWNLELLALVAISFPLRVRELRWFGYLLFAASAGWLANDTPGYLDRDLSLLVNWPMLSYASAIVLPAFAAWIVERRRDTLETLERAAVPGLAVAAAFFTAVAIPVQFDGVWIGVAWSVEALALVAISFPLRLPQLRWFGFLVFGAASVRLFAFDTPELLDRDFEPFLNFTMLAYGAAVLSAAATAVILLRRRDSLEVEDELAALVYPVWAALFAVIAIPVQVGGIWVSVGWAGEALILLALAIRFRLDTLRWFSYVVLGAMLVRLAAFDTGDVDLEEYWPVVNWRFLAFAVGIGVLYAGQWIVTRFGVDSEHPWAEDEASGTPRALFGLATLTTLWILSAEVFASADSALFDLTSNASENVSILGLTLVWGLYGALLMLAGVLRRWRWVRVAGLALLVVAVVKLFAYDSQALEQIYRVIAFIALGAILIAGGLLYQRYRHAVRGFLFADSD